MNIHVNLTKTITVRAYYSLSEALCNCGIQLKIKWRVTSSRFCIYKNVCITEVVVNLKVGQTSVTIKQHYFKMLWLLWAGFHRHCAILINLIYQYLSHQQTETNRPLRTCGTLTYRTLLTDGWFWILAKVVSVPRHVRKDSISHIEGLKHRKVVKQQHHRLCRLQAEWTRLNSRRLIGSSNKR